MQCANAMSNVHCAMRNELCAKSAAPLPREGALSVRHRRRYRLTKDIYEDPDTSVNRVK